MKKARLFLSFTAILVAMLAALMLDGQRRVARFEAGHLPHHRALVRHFELTDLAVWTEARYTRHPSQADFFSAFQDAPGSLEHFPAGSVVAPPPGLARGERSR